MDDLFFTENVMNDLINESSFFSKATLQLRVSKINKTKGISIKSTADCIQYHGNPGLREIINTSKDPDELAYIRKDTRTCFGTLNKIKERISLCIKLGDCDKTTKYYSYIKKKIY